MIRKATERSKFEKCAHLINTHKVDIIREDDEVVLNSSTRPVLPFEMHQIVVPLFNLTRIQNEIHSTDCSGKIVKVVCICKYFFTWIMPFLLSGDTNEPETVIFPARNSTRALEAGAPPRPFPNNAPPTAILVFQWSVLLPTE